MINLTFPGLSVLSLSIHLLITNLLLNPLAVRKTELTQLNYVIKESSTLEVNGKTNINSFCCTSKEAYSKMSLHYRKGSGESDIIFENAILKLQTERLDCGKKAINKDMHKTLQADTYPNIILELKEIQNTLCHNLDNCDEWFELTAVADITITCHTRTYIFPVTTKKYDTHSYRISGATSLQLCDFNIDPPTALMGLVKVKDGLEINFDLYIELI